MLRLLLAIVSCLSFFDRGSGSKEQIQQTRGGVFTENSTIAFRNGPYRIDRDIVVENGVTLTIETGVELYFDQGVGIKIHGILHAVGVAQARIRMLPYQEISDYDHSLPSFRLVDGPSTRQGRLQVLFRDKWRAVCTQNTNWTTVDYTVACRSMGFGDGGFWRWFRRNNDTDPFVMPRPRCRLARHKTLWECGSFQDFNRIPLSENLCQGEDDVGLLCWGPPSFQGWRKHWKGVEFLNAPYTNVLADPDNVAISKQSKSRLEYVDIEFAGYNNMTKNATAALLVRGIPPYINDIHITNSAGDGIRVFEPNGPVMVANSTIRHNRGHGIVVDNTTDGRVFVNQTRVEDNYGDGVWYRSKASSGFQVVSVRKTKRQSFSYEEHDPLINFCQKHFLASNLMYPYFVEAFLPNGTSIPPDGSFPCYLELNLPARLQYSFTFQFHKFANKNPDVLKTETNLLICYSTSTGRCDNQLFRIPVVNGFTPQSVSAHNTGIKIVILLEHTGASDGKVFGDIHVKLNIHATVKDEVLYGLNISNSRISENIGRGVFLQDVRDRTVVTNSSIVANQYLAGVQVFNGAGDIWINNSRIDYNWGDGINVSYVGGSIVVNGTTLRNNKMRGAAFHQNTSSPFIAMHQEIVFRGRQLNNRNFLPTIISGNRWGGILVGNFCANNPYRVPAPKVILNFIELLDNRYHPAFEYHSCQRSDQQPLTTVDLAGSLFERNGGFGIRIAPAVNIRIDMTDNRFLNNSYPALLIRNREHPQLQHLPAQVQITKNQFKLNRGKFIVSIGLNEDADSQRLMFDQQNELRGNIVIDPYPFLNPRTTPYAALIVSSSNVALHRNCFNNPKARYEIATDLPEHAKWINASENNWGHSETKEFLPKIFDQFNRFNLASISINPYASICNSQSPLNRPTLGYIRPFRSPSNRFAIGGIIYENTDLDSGTYTVTDDLHILSGAKLSIAPGTVLQFQDGIGMLVQGELVRTEYSVYGSNTEPVRFTKQNTKIPRSENIRLVGENGDFDTTSGRLELKVDGQWGAVCNRSWTVNLAGKACHQLGLILDPEFLENWLTYPEPGPLPIVIDNIRCEEQEWDLSRCRHNGLADNLNVSCLPHNVVGLRCVLPHWAGVRYSLLASPPLATGTRSMNNWIIEKAGLFDFSLPEFSAALQLDWNYHVFSNLDIRDNFWNGLDIVYNDLTRKPTIIDSKFVRNRRHGIRIRSVGLTVENSVISDNENAGIRYNPIIAPHLQRDVVTWLIRRDMEETPNQNVFVIPDVNRPTLFLDSSALNSRKFLVARYTNSCPYGSFTVCNYRLRVLANNIQSGLSGHIGIQIVNRPRNDSDENVTFEFSNQTWDIRKDLIHFPVVTDGSQMTIQYSRSKGPPAAVVLLFFMTSADYIDRFVHIYKSTIANNQYGISTLHYSNFSHWDGSHINRWSFEKLWFQKVNFTRNEHAVIWVNGPLRDVHGDSPIAEIEYFVDNCSVSLNQGSIIETHRDLHSSANVFIWRMWSSTFKANSHSGISVSLPDTYDLLSSKNHKFILTESRFYDNVDFEFELAGYFAFVNISANNFTKNWARKSSGIVLLRGMEKELVMERNRWLLNKGNWMVKLDIQSQTIRRELKTVPAKIQYNYFDQNRFVERPDGIIDAYPRSYALGLFGIQKVNVSFNRFSNFLMDFEAVTGLRVATIHDMANITYNWWGPITEPEILQRIFDFDDWNIYCLANYNPYFVTEEQFIHWWWRPIMGQQATIKHVEPSIYDLKGRLFQSVTLERIRVKHDSFPYYYKADRPYRVTKDLTVMPGATLTIQKGVEVHLYPNVRILVLGYLKAEGTFYEPVRFKPLNKTELREISLLSTSTSLRNKRDIIYQKFPLLKRQDSFYQKFNCALVAGGNRKESGFLEIWNATTGEMVPICDRQFTRRNAQVVCRELGFETNNAYVWIGPRYDYDPRIRLIKAYSEPRQCFGNEPKLSACDLRLNGDRDLWYCTDTKHFVFIHCGARMALNDQFVGHWGGIVFSAETLEESNKATEKTSLLKHVEIVGAGHAHNDSSSALELIYRSPVLSHVNVTNSSMHAIQVLAPRTQVNLERVNVTDNNGIGLNILSVNLHSSSSPFNSPLRNLTIPYHLFGVLSVCSAGKEIRVTHRLLVYYKYDSYPVDCVKYFVSDQSNRKVGFRFLQVNLYNSNDPTGRPDAIKFYDDKEFTTVNVIREFRYDDNDFGSSVQSTRWVLGMHLHANAADGKYGFLAEVASVPTAPDSAPVHQVAVSQSRFERNARGAVRYQSAGEKSPDLVIDACYFGENGYHVWGNFSTAEAAVDLDLHNTPALHFRGNTVWRNQGGLRIRAQSSSPTARLAGLIKNSVFGQNENFETLQLIGVNYQKVFVINNYFGKNRARYRDIVYVSQMTANFTSNVFYNNTGTHIVDLTGYPEVNTEAQLFIGNFLQDNTALGHGYQFTGRYGYLPADRIESDLKRKKRQVPDSDLGTSFDWWAHVGADTKRYRSTILAGSRQQQYERNLFSNPLNDFELTTVNKTDSDANELLIDATPNYWGYPGTKGAAAGRIRDAEDYSYLVGVDYLPVLVSNASLIEGDCAGGWFQAGVKEFKSCFLYFGGAMAYNDAVQFCEDQGAFMPYFRHSDARRSQISNKVNEIVTRHILDMELHSKYPPQFETQFWVSGVQVPSGQCGRMSSRSGSIETHNCQRLLPFICETGEMGYQQPFLETAAGIAVLVAGLLLLCLIVALITGWYFKSRKRQREFFERKNSIRVSIQSNKLAIERAKQEERSKQMEPQPTIAPSIERNAERPASPDLIAQAHKNLVTGRSTDSSPTSLKRKLHSSTGSLSTCLSETSSYPYKTKGSPSYTESAYRSDYSPTNDSYFSGSVPEVPSRRPVRDSQATLSSFKSPQKSSVPAVIYRNGRMKGKPVGNRNDTLVSDVSCSTCPTASSVSYDTNGPERDSRVSCSTCVGSSAASTVTHPSSARSSASEDTMTDDTIDNARSGVYGRKLDLLSSPLDRHKPPLNTGSNSHLEENENDYLQRSMTPAKDWERNAGGYALQPRPFPMTANRPARPPPPAPGASEPNLAYPGINRTSGNESLMKLTGRHDPSRSVNNVSDEASWRPPNLSSFSLASTASPSRTKGDGKVKPLETAM